MWKGSGRSLFRTLVLENAKFAVLLIVPIFTASLAWNDTVVESVVRSRQYVNYPPEGPPPPANHEELQARLEERKRNRQAAGERAVGSRPKIAPE